LAEFEELVLSVRVDDQASTQIDQLKRTVSDLGTGSQAAGFERFKRQTQDLDETIKRFISQIGEGPRAFAEFARGAGAMGAGMLSLGYAMTEGLRKMREYSAEIVNLGGAAAPAARCRNCRRGSFILNPPSTFTSFDHLVGAAGERQRHRDAKRLGGLEIQE